MLLHLCGASAFSSAQDSLKNDLSFIKAGRIHEPALVRTFPARYSVRDESKDRNSACVRCRSVMRCLTMVVSNMNSTRLNMKKLIIGLTSLIALGHIAKADEVDHALATQIYTNTELDRQRAEHDNRFTDALTRHSEVMTAQAAEQLAQERAERAAAAAEAARQYYEAMHSSRTVIANHWRLFIPAVSNDYNHDGQIFSYKDKNGNQAAFEFIHYEQRDSDMTIKEFLERNGYRNADIIEIDKLRAYMSQHGMQHVSELEVRP
jgi:hypothetical protein